MVTYNNILFAICIIGLIYPASAYCTIFREVTYANGAYTVNLSTTQELEEVTLYDSANISLRPTDYYGYTCRHSDYNSATDTVKIYLPNKFNGFSCSYKIHTKKILRFYGYAYFYRQGYGRQECEILNKGVIPLPTTTTTTHKTTTTTHKKPRVTQTTKATTTSSSSTTTTLKYALDKDKTDKLDLTFAIIILIAAMILVIIIPLITNKIDKDVDKVLKEEKKKDGA